MSSHLVDIVLTIENVPRAAVEPLREWIHMYNPSLHPELRHDNESKDVTFCFGTMKRDEFDRMVRCLREDKTFNYSPKTGFETRHLGKTTTFALN